MRTHFRNEMADLERAVRQLGVKVCENIQAVAEGLRQVDRARAAAVMRADRDIDLSEVRNEEDSLKIIALHQPVADDLRYLVVMLKVNHELERISDLAVELAGGVHLLAPEAEAEEREAVARLAELAAGRLEKVLKALVAKDADEARVIWRADAEINKAVRELRTRLQGLIAAAAKGHAALFALLEAGAHVERLGDHVKNIAKDVIYLVRGEIVRHRARDFRDGGKPRRLRVLFVCIRNSARSQMAEAWLNHLFGEHFEAASAGLEPGVLHPLAVGVMREAGLDISNRPTRDVHDVLEFGEVFDYLITVCDEAHAAQCPPAHGARAELHWTFPDPVLAEGSPEEQRAIFRQVRDAIRERIATWAPDIWSETRHECGG